MEHYRIEISDLAKAQLVEIRDYIAKELYSPATARTTLHLLENNILSLSKLPHRHEKVEDKEWENKGIRKYQVKNFLIYYSIHEESRVVAILGIMYAKRNPAYLLKKLQ